MNAINEANKYLDGLSNAAWKKQTGDLVSRDEANTAIKIALEKRTQEIALWIDYWFNKNMKTLDLINAEDLHSQLKNDYNSDMKKEFRSIDEMEEHYFPNDQKKVSDDLFEQSYVNSLKELKKCKETIEKIKELITPLGEGCLILDEVTYGDNDE